MKATERITVKRSFCILFFLILVGTAGCTTNNNGGSPGNDSGVADGPVQVARDVQAQLADASPAYSGDAAMPDAIGRPRTRLRLMRSGRPTMSHRTRLGGRRRA